MSKRKHVLELNYIRAIAAFGIFAIHATGGFVMYSEFNSNAMKLGIIINQFFRSGSQVFMMISGFVLFYNYRNPDEFNPKKFYKKKAVFLIVPYVLWSVAYLLFKTFKYHIPLEVNWFSQFIRDLLLGSSFSHLYFIFLIVQFYLIFPLLIKYLSRSMQEKPIKVFTITAILQAIILVYEFYFRAQTEYAILNLINSIYWKTILGWFFYFIGGGIIAYHYEKMVAFINKRISLIVVGYLLTMVIFLGEVYLDVFSNNSLVNYEKYGSIRPLNMIYGLMTFLILVYITRRIKENSLISKVLGFIGSYSLGIYFAHPMILEWMKITLFQDFPQYFGYGRLSSLIVVVGLGWILTLIFCYIVANFKYRWLLLGKTPATKFGIEKRKEQTV